jgi:N-acetylglucosamine kinase-like BadF-type ATPase
VLATVRGPGSSPHRLGVPRAIALIDELITDARARAGLPGEAVLDRAEVYLAGADLPAEVEIVDRAVGEAGWALKHRVGNDTFALLRAGTDDPDAVAVVCGAGINCVGLAADGRTARFLSLGRPRATGAVGTTSARWRSTTRLAARTGGVTRPRCPTR